jgi:hypothetical protein
VDILVENAHVLDEFLRERESIPLLYKEVLENDTIKFVPTLIEEEQGTSLYFGHETKNCLIREDLDWLETHKIAELIKQ